MNGIRLVTEFENCKLFYIDEVSEELLLFLREYFCEICYGKIQVQESRKMSDLKITLKTFIDRYSSKTEKQKKGIIGELIAHLLIRIYQKNFTPVSIFFNKEEASMRKGFDIIFLDDKSKKVLYCEVKSGELNSRQTSNEKNIYLLNTAYTDIKEKFELQTDTPWDSALIDANLTTEIPVRERLKNILENQAPSIREGNLKGNAILVSILYEKMENPILYDSIIDFHNIIKECLCLNEVIIFSIQKATYTKIENILRDELKNA